MAVCIAYRSAAGSISIVRPVPSGSKEGETEADWIDRVKREVVPAGASEVTVIDEAQVPSDRTFRNALTLQGGSIVHDMVIAREQLRQKLRVTRAPQLAALDVAYQRADEIADLAAKAEIVAAKTALRDITADPAIEAAQTIEQLKAVWPAILGGAKI